MKKIKIIIKLISIIFYIETGFAQSLSPNGYSGLGLVPNSNTLGRGDAVISYEPTIPGAKINKGSNYQVGFGIANDFEIVGRLATNNQKCNMFNAGECPQSTYRDFSSSVKWSVPIDWLKQNNSAVSVGVTDFGGAATYFRSYYLVGNKKFDKFDFSLGRATAKATYAPLKGTFTAINWELNNSTKLSLQKVDQTTSAHALLQVPLLDEGMNGWITLNQRLSNNTTLEKNWISFGVNFSLDRVQKKMTDIQSVKNNNSAKTKELKLTDPSTILDELKKKGFFNTKFGTKTNGKIVFVVENTSYGWNILDAAGVAMGVIASAYSAEPNERLFELVITTRGVGQLKVVGEVKCVGLWLSKGEVCSKLYLESLMQQNSDMSFFSLINGQTIKPESESIIWESGESWYFRPEVAISPTVVSALGTEYGALDFDLGVNVNTVLPLWTGATLESNRLVPLGVGTRQFELQGAFYDARLKGITNRKLVHQLINLPAINTQARYSIGTAYSVWNGQQLETSTQSSNGRHKLGITSGSFHNEEASTNQERSYNLVNYRFANNDQQTAVTEVTQGKFWAGDKGFAITQRFWYGDTSLSIYFRRTRMLESQALVSFAGLQLAFPFTPRENRGLDYVGIRGTNQWTYALESRVLDRQNFITGGMGEVPRIGESLVSTFNRDRNSTRYYESNMDRLRNAYVNLGNN